MKSQECQTQRLAEYIDGELSGTERLDVSRHLEHCMSCGEEANALRQVGELLRAAAALEPAPAGLEGLASGVVSRTSAERAQSWRAMFEHAVEDWHWFLVGSGSVAAALVSVTFVSAVLHFGPARQRDDSVSGLLSNRDWRVTDSEGGGSLYVWATPGGTDMRIMLTGQERAEAAADAATIMPASLAGLTTEGEFVGALGDALMRTGQPIDVRAMDAGTRSHAEALLNQLTKMNRRYRQQEMQGEPAAGPSSIYRMQVVTNTEVSGKGL
jgi:anti-sigma factor RsiW